MQNKPNYSIGDYVKADHIITKICAIRDNGFIQTNHGNTNLRVITPIKLTKQILIDCGADDITGDYYYFGDVFIIFYNDKFYFELKSGSLEIDYLHELQQLIRLLTGKEIEYNDNKR